MQDVKTSVRIQDLTITLSGYLLYASQSFDFCGRGDGRSSPIVTRA